MGTVRRTACFLALALALASTALLGGRPVSASVDLEDFTIPPPAGYSVSTNLGAMLGVHSFTELSQITGQSVAGVPDDLAAELEAFVQAWDAPDGGQGISMIWAAPSDSDGAEVLAGSLDAAGTDEFETGVPGQFGRIVQGDGFVAYVVLWQQGRFAAYVFAAAGDAASGKALALDIAQRQLARMSEVLGSSAELVTEPAADSTEPSTAYRVGQMTGGVVVVGGLVVLIVWLVMRSNKKRRPLASPWPAGAVPPFPGQWPGQQNPWSGPAQAPPAPVAPQMPPPPPPPPSPPMGH